MHVRASGICDLDYMTLSIEGQGERVVVVVERMKSNTKSGAKKRGLDSEKDMNWPTASKRKGTRTIQYHVTLKGEQRS
jgi:hypothetical protein